MKNKLFSLFLLFFAMTLTSAAQDEITSVEEQPESLRQTFRFIYIAPDDNMDKNRLLSAIENHYNYVVSEGSPAIFYLVNNDTPLVVKFNMAGANENDYETELLYNLRHTMSWRADAVSDRRNIMALLADNDFVDSSGEMNYANMELDFHVGKKFWDSKYNESVIAAIFFELNAVKYIAEKRMQFNVFFRLSSQKGTFDRSAKYFGDMNLDNINEIIEPRVEN